MIRLALVLAVAACSKAPDPPATTQELARPSRAPTQELARARPSRLVHVTIKALGMTCEESCPMRVRYALHDEPAVYELGFDLDHEAIFVSYDAALGPAKQVTKPLVDDIRRAGFDPWLAAESWPDDAKAQVVARADR